MKILVLSDSHGDKKRMAGSVRTEKPDMIIHLGDCISDFKALTEEFPGIEAYGVKGNCDLRLISYFGRERLIITAEGKSC
jgi:Predicted phosphoesterase